jgi:hypothetical protein
MTEWTARRLDGPLGCHPAQPLVVEPVADGYRGFGSPDAAAAAVNSSNPAKPPEPVSPLETAKALLQREIVGVPLWGWLVGVVAFRALRR